MPRQKTPPFTSLLAMVALCTLPLSGAERPIPPDGNGRKILVELFTSEGCSSCPPADSFLREIDGRRLPSGEVIIGLSEHVTYWNHLGWSDPFSSELFTRRQNDYSDRFGRGSSYTPQMVVNGSREAVGNDRAAVLHAIQSATAETAGSALNLHIESMAREGDSLVVSFRATADSAPSHNVEIYAAVADDFQQANVARGENKGHTLAHTAVARNLARVSSLHLGDLHTARIHLPSSAGPVARHLVLFAQIGGSGRVLAVDSRPIGGLGPAEPVSAQPPASPAMR